MPRLICRLTLYFNQKNRQGTYLNFLRGGSSQDPLDLLRGAGVDMATPQPVDHPARRVEGA